MNERNPACAAAERDTAASILRLVREAAAGAPPAPGAQNAAGIRLDMQPGSRGFFIRFQLHHPLVAHPDGELMESEPDVARIHAFANCAYVSAVDAGLPAVPRAPTNAFAFIPDIGLAFVPGRDPGILRASGANKGTPAEH